MKITGFRPMIVTKDVESAIKVFEALGFERQHTKRDIEGGSNINYTMKDANGFSVHIASSQKAEITAVSINVDNFKEAFDFFIDHGYVNPRGDKVTDTSSSKDTMLFSPSGAAVVITEHIK